MGDRTVNRGPQIAVAVFVCVIIISAAGPTISASNAQNTQKIPTEKKQVETFSGTAFSTPPALEDEIQDFRERLPRDLAPHVFVLATHDEVSVVFTDQEPTTGKASVQGRSLTRSLSAKDMEFNVILASSVSFDTEGEQTSLSSVTENPKEYQQDLVKIQAHHRRVSILNDPDQGQNVTAAVSSGVLTENPQTASDLFSRPAEKARSLGVNTSTTELGSSSEQEIDQLLNTDQERLYTFDFQEQYWTDGEETVDGIVLTPGSKAREFVSTFDSTGVIKTGANAPLLYVVETEQQGTQYDSVQEIKSDASDGEVVEVTANLDGERISSQETLEETTSCGNSQAQVPTPSGPICVDILQDVVIDAGVAWNSVPESRDDVLLVAGLSSRHLDEQSEQLQGEYRITGVVVSTARFDESLPEGKVLLINDLQRTGDVEFESLSESSQSAIDGRFSSLRDSLNTQFEGAESADDNGLIQETFEFDPDESGGISAITVYSDSEPAINFETEHLVTRPEDFPEPPGDVERVYEIAISQDYSIRNATVRISLPTGEVENTSALTAYRYQNGEWNELSSTVISENDRRIVFQFETPGFSYFAITSQTPGSEESRTSTQPETTTPAESSTTTTPSRSSDDSDDSLVGYTPPTPSEFDTNPDKSENGEKSGTASDRSTVGGPSVLKIKNNIVGIGISVTLMIIILLNSLYMRLSYGHYDDIEGDKKEKVRKFSLWISIGFIFSVLVGGQLNDWVDLIIRAGSAVVVVIVFQLFRLGIMAIRRYEAELYINICAILTSLILIEMSFSGFRFPLPGRLSIFVPLEIVVSVLVLYLMLRVLMHRGLHPQNLPWR